MTTSKKPKVSIIIPVYGVEEYLPQCLDSILGQTYDNLEVILIDDESPDNCPQMCDDYAKKDKRVKVIHKKNGGQGVARNVGIDKCKGEYIVFVDSDDFIEKDAIELMLERSIKDNSDMVLCDSLKVFDDLPSKNQDGLGEATLKKGSLRQKDRILASLSPWGKLYKRELFANPANRYPASIWYEDYALIPKILSEANFVSYVNKPLYCYRVRQGSTMNNKNYQRNMEIITASDKLLGYFEQDGTYDEFKDELEYLVAYHVITSAVQRIFLSGFHKDLAKELYDYVANKFPDFRKNHYVIRHRKESLHWRILTNLLFNRLFWLTFLFVRTKKVFNK